MNRKKGIYIPDDAEWAGAETRAWSPALYCGEFAPTEKDRKLYDLAKQYHDETELYDRGVCSGRTDDGIAMPVDNYELVMINRNAHKVRKRLLKENPGIESAELNRAIGRYIPEAQ